VTSGSGYVTPSSAIICLKAPQDIRDGTPVTACRVGVAYVLLALGVGDAHGDELEFCHDTVRGIRQRPRNWYSVVAGDELGDGRYGRLPSTHEFHILFCIRHQSHAHVDRRRK
jgi:hypothetical protein